MNNCVKRRSHSEHLLRRTARVAHRYRRSGHTLLYTLLALLCMKANVLAQQGTASSDTPSGLTVLPTIRLMNLGWDDNVFRVSKEADPQGDFVGTVTPAARASLRTGRVFLTGRGQLDFNYFRRFHDIRSIDSDFAGRAELVLGRIAPYLGGEWTNAKHRRGLEIDLPVRRVDHSWYGGVDLRISSRTSIGVMTRYSGVNYEGDAIFEDIDLAQYLGARSRIHGMRLRYSLTPLTTIGVEAERDRNTFALATERNSEGVRITSVVEFQPLAIVSGRAQVGIRRRNFADGAIANFGGTVVRVDLAYTLLGRTRIGVTGRRDLAYSYRIDQRDYLQSGFDLSVNHRLTDAWDVVGTMGRYNLVYDLAAGRTRSERVRSQGVDVGYRIQRTRLGFQVARDWRTSDFSVRREYEGMRITSSMSYEF